MKKSNKNWQHRIIEKNGQYFFQGSTSNIPISNFTMKVLFLLESTTCPKRIVEITNMQGKKIIFEMPADAMTSCESFSKILERKGNFIFSGNKASLFALKQVLFQDERKAIQIEYLGYQRKFNLFAFSNGVFDEKGSFHPIGKDGTVEVDGNIFYIASANEIIEGSEQVELQNQRLFQHKTGTCSFEEWVSLFQEVFNENGIIGLSYFLASFYRDVIFDELNCFPHLFLAGKPQSGKSTFRRILMNFFGHEQTSIHCGIGSTQKALSRKLAQLCNAFISCEEYKNDIDKKLIETMKGVYDGEGYERAVKSNDNQTFTTSVKSALIIAGQELPTKESSLFTRLILLEFNQTEFASSQQAKLAELIKISEKGLTHIVGELLIHRSLIRAKFQEVLQLLIRYFKEKFKRENISDRVIINYCAVLAPLYIFQDENIYKFSFLTDKSIDLFEQVIRQHVSHLKATDELNEFWQTLKLLIETSVLRENENYLFKTIEGKNCICIRWETTYDKYLEQRQKRRLAHLDKQTLSSYLKNDKSFHPGRGHGKCHFIKILTDSKSFFCFDTALIEVDFSEKTTESQKMLYN
ncbi:MAG: DUF927 domain-containing protein [Chitinophagaceae bacterium]